jgi:hypothetical protein
MVEDLISRWRGKRKVDTIVKQSAALPCLLAVSLSRRKAEVRLAAK